LMVIVITIQVIIILAAIIIVRIVVDTLSTSGSSRGRIFFEIHASTILISSALKL
jgi:hypothetical protein